MSPNAETNLFLNALVAPKQSLELRTTVFSRTNLDSLLGESPAAITFSRPGVLDVERLLGAYMKNNKLFRPIADSRSIGKWRCYKKEEGDLKLALRQLLDYAQVFTTASAFARQLARSPTTVSICVLVPENRWTSQHDEEIRAALGDALLCSHTGKASGAIQAKHYTVSVPSTSKLRAPVAPANASSERETLLRERKKMLDVVGTYTSEELASAVGSTTGNASQFAADQRKTSKLFGVRFGQSWLYPKFQFDARRQTLSEMKSVLSALSPDDQGWDRLQWFLQPHEALRGRTPLEVWKTHRQKVIEAASTERWDARD